MCNNRVVDAQVFLFVVTITEWLTPRCTDVVILPISAMAYCNKSLSLIHI